MPIAQRRLPHPAKWKWERQEEVAPGIFKVPFMIQGAEVMIKKPVQRFLFYVPDTLYWAITVYPQLEVHRSDGHWGVGQSLNQINNEAVRFLKRCLETETEENTNAKDQR